MKFAANITLIDFGLPVLGRVQAARDKGFDGIECLFPYDHSLADWGGALAGTPVALINFPEPDWAKGARGCGAVPGQEAAFQSRARHAQQYAQQLGADRLHVLSGNAVGDVARDTLVTNLRWAADNAPDLMHTIEPLNPADMPGYFLNDYQQAIDILAQVDRPNVALQYDAWHAQRIHGSALKVWQDCCEHVAHVQIAGLDARNAPDMTSTAEVALIDTIRGAGYTGWISAEYFPDAKDDPDWLVKARRIVSSGSVA